MGCNLLADGPSPRARQALAVWLP